MEDLLESVPTRAQCIFFLALDNELINKVITIATNNNSSTATTITVTAPAAVYFQLLLLYIHVNRLH